MNQPPDTSTLPATAAYDRRSAVSRTLSKSDFTLARTCSTKLYFRENRFPDTK